jgi:5-methyltetrahydropteroyltriglutamate--homocysteine methyltransferase
MGEKLFPTAPIGSYPRPLWFNLGIGRRDFKAAMAESAFREQYLDALAVIINDQERAGMDIVSDGDIRTDAQAGGRGWFFYLIDRLSGYSQTADDSNTLWKKRWGEGSIFAEIIEAYQPPIFTGKVGLKIPLRYADMWKLAQERATRPVKFDGIASVNIASMCWDRYYKKKADMTADVSKILNREYRDLVTAGCKKIQIDEPHVHFTAADPKATKDQIQAEKDYFNDDVRGVDAEIWAHSCWGNPNQQHGEDMETISYEKAIPHMLDLKADVLTFEMSSTGGRDLKFFKDYPTKKKKIGIGVIDHVSCQVETPKQVAKLIREATKYIEPGHLVITSDCGFGREGFGRRIAYYKLRSMVEGARIVREEIEGKK